MRMLRWITPLLAVAFFGTGCNVCEPLGPPCATMTIGVSKEGEELASHTFVVNINDKAQPDKLTPSIQTRRFRVEVQTERRRGYRPYDDGTIYVSALSEDLGVLSRTKRKRAYTDRVTHFEFRISDFRLLSLANTASDALIVLIEGENEKSVELAPGETKEVWVDWEFDDEYDLRIRDLRTGEERRETVRFGEDESRPGVQITRLKE